MITITKGEMVLVSKGDHFDLLLPDGTLLNVEQTGDDFSITRATGPNQGVVCYSQPTSESAKASDGQDSEREVISGRG